MTSSNFLTLTRFLPIKHSYQVSASSELNQKKFLKNLPLLSCFYPSTPPLIGYYGNNEWSILKLLISKDGLYIGLKSQKISWRLVKPFLRYLAKPLRGIFPLPLQIGLTNALTNAVCCRYCWISEAFYRSQLSAIDPEKYYFWKSSVTQKWHRSSELTVIMNYALHKNVQLSIHPT